MKKEFEKEFFKKKEGNLNKRRKKGIFPNVTYLLGGHRWSLHLK
jgi:hypothetical protein